MSKLDLDAYFQRIDYTGARNVSLPTLNAMIEAHIRSIPFETLDVLLGHEILLDIESLQQKLVTNQRGGYCFEQNGLFMHVLTALGYDVSPISARIRLKMPRDIIPPRTHMFLRVELEGKSWLVDVGVGGLSATAAIELKLDKEQPSPHETRRIIKEGDTYFHQALLQNEWNDLCEFTLEEMPFIDQEVASWYTASHPKSVFKSAILVAKSMENGGRKTIYNSQFSIRDASGKAEKQAINDQASLIHILAEHFNLHFPSNTDFNLSAIVDDPER